MLRAVLAYLCSAAASAHGAQLPTSDAALFDARFPRTTAAALRAEARAGEAPQVPFVNFSAAYVARALAEPIDWTTRGAVTPVKNQGPHGFCGTFGRVGSAEGQWALRSGKGLTSFSEQMLVDCAGWDLDQYAFFSPKGFETSAAYPYNLSSGYPDVDPPVPGNPCVFDAKKVVPGTPGFFTFRTGEAPDERQLAAFIHHNGPVSAGIDANVFKLREPGCEARGDCFINATACASGTVMDHSIVIVGYGSDPVRGDYWKIKNSWSTKFANAGFIDVARGVQCGGLCSDPSICGNVFGHGSNASYFE